MMGFRRIVSCLGDMPALERWYWMFMASRNTHTPTHTCGKISGVTSAFFILVLHYERLRNDVSGQAHMCASHWLCVRVPVATTGPEDRMKCNGKNAEFGNTIRIHVASVLFFCVRIYFFFVTESRSIGSQPFTLESIPKGILITFAQQKAIHLMKMSHLGLSVIYYVQCNMSSVEDVWSDKYLCLDRGI